MSHPAEGVLRRLLDEPFGVAVSDRRHVHDCPRCLDDLAAIRRDADAVGAALSVDGGADLDAAAAWRRLSAAVATGPAPRAAKPDRRGRVHGLLRRPAAAVLAFTVVLAGAGTAAANDWLQIFETEKVAPVSITTGDLVALPDLSAYGTLTLTSEPNVHEVPDAAAAEAETGLDVPKVDDLPAGVSGGPVVQVGGQASATFTFSAAKAAQAAAEAGGALPALPPGLDGTSVRLDAGPGVLRKWESDSGAPALIVGRAVVPTAFSTGVPFEQVRNYLLALPGLPGEIAEQLRTFAADGSTLPLPVPADEVKTASADVDGAPATVVTTRDGTLAAVVWVEDGEVTVVAGSLDDSEALSVSRGLR